MSEVEERASRRDPDFADRAAEDVPRLTGLVRALLGELDRALADSPQMAQRWTVTDKAAS